MEWMAMPTVSFLTELEFGILDVQNASTDNLYDFWLMIYMVLSPKFIDTFCIWVLFKQVSWLFFIFFYFFLFYVDAL